MEFAPYYRRSGEDTEVTKYLLILRPPRKQEMMMLLAAAAADSKLVDYGVKGADGDTMQQIHCTVEKLGIAAIPWWNQ